jgi:ACS family hexuronate transporter-like MFS transporter
LFWLPLYFRDVRGLEMSQIGWALPCIYFSSGIGSVTAGWFSGFLLREGRSKRAARLMTLLICAVLVPLGLLCAAHGSLIPAVAMFSVAAAAHQGVSSISFTLSGDVFPAQVLGTILGFGSFAGTVSSVVFSALVPGYLIPVLGYKPLLLMLSLGYLAAVAVIQAHFGDFRPIRTDATPVPRAVRPISAACSRASRRPATGPRD